MVFGPTDLDDIYELIETCKGVEQDPTWHPEGDVYNHSFQVLRHALRESDDTDLILAAFCHDAGKAIRSHGHENESVKLVESLLSMRSLWLIKQHMRIWYLLLGDMKKQSKVLELLRHPWLPDLVALARWDKMGRSPNREPYLNKLELISILNTKAENHFKGDTYESKTS